MQVSRYDILGKLPAFKNHAEVWQQNQSTQDIIDGILKCHELDKDQYDLISDQFVGKTVRQTAENVFDFEKRYIPYHIEDEDKQTVRVPAGIVAMPGDCKNYALFANGVFDSLNRKGRWKVPIAYRFASYDITEREPKHVFSVLFPGTEDEIWVDPVLAKFDQDTPPVYFKDKKIKPMALVRISGVTVNDRIPLSNDQKLARLKWLRDGLIAERKDQIRTGQLQMLSEKDQEYTNGIQALNQQIARGGIGFIDPVSITTAVSLVTSLFGHHDDGPGYLGWDRLDVQRGDGLAASAADVIKNRRTDVPMSDLLSWIQSRPDSIQLLLNQKKYGTVTMDDIANYFEFRGYPNEAKAFRTGVTNNTPPSSLANMYHQKDDKVINVMFDANRMYMGTDGFPRWKEAGYDLDSSTKKDNTVLYLALAGVGVYLLTKKKGR